LIVSTHCDEPTAVHDDPEETKNAKDSFIGFVFFEPPCSS
jgi:hypothetical protein